MDDGSGAGQGRDSSGRFAAGNPGRPFGARNRLSRRVARAILKDFEANQVELLARLRRWFMPQYVTLVSRLLPKQTEAGGAELDAAPDEAEIARMIGQMRAALDRIEAGGGTLEDLEAALLGESGGAGAVDNGD